MTIPGHHEQRPGALDAVQRLRALRDAVGGTTQLFDLVGGKPHFEQLVATHAQLVTYFGPQQSLPREEPLQRIRCFLNAVEPALEAGTPIMQPAALRVLLRSDIAARAQRATEQTRRYR